MTTLNLGVTPSVQQVPPNLLYGYQVTLQADTTARALNNHSMGYYSALNSPVGSDRPIIAVVITNLEASGGGNILIGNLDSCNFPILPQQTISIPAAMLSEVAIAGSAGGEDVAILLVATDP